MTLSRRSFTLSLLALAACGTRTTAAVAGEVLDLQPGVRGLPSDPPTVTPLRKSDAEWLTLLPRDAYDVLRAKGTERSFTGRYADHHVAGTYLCAGCGLSLFRSADKFESGTGWPSFTRPVSPAYVKLREDNGWFTTRTEVLCARCDGHLGHVFDDGPAPTGKRYCMNSVALVFRKA